MKIFINHSGLRKKYETEKNLATIELQKSKLRNRKSQFYFFGTAVVLAVISLLLFFNYKAKSAHSKQKLLVRKSKNLQSTKAVLKGEEQERSD